MTTKIMTKPVLTNPAGSLLEIIYRLSELLQEETALLRRQDVAAILPIQDSKSQLFIAYSEAIAAIEADPSQLQDMDEAARAHLASAMNSLAEVMQDNRRALKAARDSRRFVLDAIRTAVQEQQAQVTSYNRGGKTQHSVYAKSSKTAVSVAVNQQM